MLLGLTIKNISFFMVPFVNTDKISGVYYIKTYQMFILLKCFLIYSFKLTLCK